MASSLETSLADQLGRVQAENRSLKEKVEVLTEELGLVLDWIGKTFGATIVNKNSAHYKSVHQSSFPRESIERSLAFVLAPEAAEEEGEDTMTEGPENSSTYSGDSTQVTAQQQSSETQSLAPRINVRTPLEVPASGTSTIPAATAVQQDPEDNTQGGQGRHRRPRSCFKKTSDTLCQCQYCPRSFTHENSKIIHERTHTGERPYQCRFCNKTFVGSSGKISHERSHTGERPYKCRYCPDSFAHSHVKRRHELIHIGHKPYQCEFCDRKFMRREEARSHILRVHQGGNTKFIISLLNPKWQHACVS